MSQSPEVVLAKALINFIRVSSSESLLPLSALFVAYKRSFDERCYIGHTSASGKGEVLAKAARIMAR